AAINPRARITDNRAIPGFGSPQRRARSRLSQRPSSATAPDGSPGGTAFMWSGQASGRFAPRDWRGVHVIDERRPPGNSQRARAGRNLRNLVVARDDGVESSRGLWGSAIVPICVQRRQVVAAGEKGRVVGLDAALENREGALMQGGGLARSPALRQQYAEV